MKQQYRNLKVTYSGHCYGRVVTKARPTATRPNRPGHGEVIKVEKIGKKRLARLWVDLFDFYGRSQPWLKPWQRRELARWILRHGVRKHGHVEFCQEVARCWLLAIKKPRTD